MMLVAKGVGGASDLYKNGQSSEIKILPPHFFHPNKSKLVKTLNLQQKISFFLGGGALHMHPPYPPPATTTVGKSRGFKSFESCKACENHILLFYFSN